jgi:small subunit ribosomal protein S16
VLAIRLTRMGTHKRPFYRLVVADKQSKRDGRFVEIVGYYNPIREPNELVVKQDRIDYWLACGAQPTGTVKGLIKRAKKEAETASA